MSKDIVYKVVTDSLIKALESAIENDDLAPWDKPWSMWGDTPMAIRRWDNGKPYRGINVWILLGSGRPGPWLTYNQAKKAGGNIKQEEAKKYTTICFWKINKYPDPDDPTKQKTIPMLRYYRVYSIEQAEGLPEKRWMQKEEQQRTKDQPSDPFEKAQQLWEGYTNKPTIIEGGDRAAYSPGHDHILMPTKAQFLNNHADQTIGYAHYYNTLFHEGAHSTGHPSRLHRFESKQQYHTFGSDSYSKEELVAEMTTAYLQALAGITVKKVRDNSVAYLQAWIKRLQNDPRFAVQAASQAQKACDYMLGINWKDGQEGTGTAEEG